MLFALEFIVRGGRRGGGPAVRTRLHAARRRPWVALLVPLILGVSGEVGLHAQVGPTTKSLTVHVADALSGAPIVGAPVQVIGQPYLKTTNAEGKAKFPRIPQSVQEVRVWTTPEGYAPGFDDVTLDRPVTHAVLVPVPEDRFTTGLISAAEGGEFVLRGTLGAGFGTPFYMEIVVPPGSLYEDASISVAPFPSWAVRRPGMRERGYPLGMFHLNLRDAAGEKITEQLLLPITIKMKSWLMETPTEYDGVDPHWGVLYSFDYQTHEFVEEDANFSVDMARDLLVFQLSHLSCFGAEFDPKIEGWRAFWEWIYSDDEEDSPDDPVPDPVVRASFSCESRASGPVECGRIMAGGASWGASKGTAVTVSSSFAAGLKAKYGSKTGPPLAQITAEIEASLTVTTSGSVTGTTTVNVEGHWEGGDVATASPCYDGSIEGILVWKVYTVSVGGTDIGTISVPWSTMKKRTLSWNNSCPGCGDEPKGLPVTDATPCDP